MQLPSWPKIKELLAFKEHKRKNFFHDHPLLGGGIVISVFFLALVLFLYFWNLAPVNFNNSQQQMVEIRYGTSLREISTLLEYKGIIRNRYIYELYVRLKPSERMAKSGRYLIGSGMTVPQIVSELGKGTSGQIRVTIPEGFTNVEIAELLSKKGIIDRDEFLRKLTDVSFLSQLGLELPLDGNVEGFLYPDTYYFSLDATEEQVITTMLRRFTEIYQSYFQNVPLSELKEIVIVASIVEKEAKEADERPLIAGVFYNRLQRKFPLQSCATIQYVLGKHKDRLLYKDLQVQSPYNTYLNRGLPPGPIANPGLASLQAAVDPGKVTYLYFVAKPDGSHIFSNTFEQHIKAQRVASRLRRE